MTFKHVRLFYFRYKTIIKCTIQFKFLLRKQSKVLDWKDEQDKTFPCSEYMLLRSFIIIVIFPRRITYEL